ncbi:phage portal protein [Clostridium tagluense]|uniref:phage portal protein n=1 Tax=Clostridium tagluense TaxID=360422 RepID=UPI001CF14277|nr:phage portal protein [Clostridium tagluense]MCB2311614.1 phage portal protein [Clostridium tagluense]MCB2316338.1 phage portal protein [Clostridium tagluense]MCB2321278.1 phage portal protein [Clostridium tagluense]MCB2326207.1 phage portal protein [Clostridium tagluense]MCB2331014.1 phage portal protein [Clostridium tagluense]
MKFNEWISSFFGIGQTTINLTQTQIAGKEQSLQIEMFAIACAIDLIANSISKCNFKTYNKGVEYKGDEFYLWNIEPNKNQNSSQFLQKLITNLLYDNECLVLDVNGQLIIADSFFQNEYAVVENSFINVVSGTMKFDKTFKMSDVMYFKLGNNNIRNLLSNVILGYNDLLNMSIGKYKRSGGRKGILDIDGTAMKDEKFQEKFATLMNKRFATYFEAENAVLPLEKGYTYNEQNGEGSKKSTSEIVDINTLTKEIFERVAQAFKIPPALLKGDISDVSSITDNLLTFGIDPLCDMISEEGNRKRFGKKAFLENTYLKVDSTSIKHIDLFSISEKFDKLLASGGYSIDELRVKAGDTPLNTDFSKQHYITKNYQKIETLGQETTTTTITK